mgnify:CR=1 FL=1
MNKINQNKITFTFILAAIIIIFSSLLFLSLPVLFNYKSKVDIIERNFFNNFKINLNIFGNISYKPFPRPHLLVENSSLNISKNKSGNNLVKVNDLKIFISLRDIYLRSFKNIISAEILNTNINFKENDLLQFRNHLYKNINKKINIKNSKFFLRNSNNEVILISPIEKIIYKINNKSKLKSFIINGEVFGVKYKSEWIRNYNYPKESIHTINLIDPKVEIRNKLINENNKNFKIVSEIQYIQNKIIYNINFNESFINISSPNKENLNFKINTNINLNPFYFTGSLIVKKIKVENIIDNLLLNLILYDREFLGNLNGKFEVKFNEIDNKLIKNGKISFNINEKKINLEEIKFDLGSIGELTSKINFEEDKGEIKFLSKNRLIIKNHIEFAKIFQLGSKKVKKLNQIDFELEKAVGSSDFTIKNVKINNSNNMQNITKKAYVKNIQNLRVFIREFID